MPREENARIIIEGEEHDAVLQWIEQNDRNALRELYEDWRSLTDGLIEFNSRGPNLPEGISESAFALEFGCPRVLQVEGSSSSFDCYDPNLHHRLQIKATSIENDLTSFGPRSVWDVLYFLDFFRNGDFDRTFDVYEIPNDLIFNFQINQTQTFRDQQLQGRRPRFGIKRQIISPNNIEPLRTCTI